MEEMSEAHVVPLVWRKRYCDTIAKGDLLEFQNIFQICGDKVFFPIDSIENCKCWSVPLENIRIGIQTFMGYPLCQRLTERICSGTCDCTDTQYGRFVWFTSLHLACYYGQVEIVKLLIRSCHCTALFQKRALLTPLMVTSLSDAKDVAPHIASLLIDAGADIDEQDVNGFSALHLAVINNNTDLVKLYLKRDANVNVLAFAVSFESNGTVEVEKSGLSALWFAARFLPSDSYCEELLLNAGANVTGMSMRLCPLVAVGHKEGSAGVLRYIKSPGFNINYRYPYLGTQLMNVIHVYCSSETDEELRGAFFQVIEYLLEMGIDVNAEDDGGWTAVFFCSQEYEVLELLISHGADVKHVSSDGVTPLMEAFKTSKPIATDTQSCVHLLLENGVNPSAVSEYGCNALLYALEYSYQNESDLRLLFEYNMDMEVVCISLIHEFPKPLLYTAYDYANFKVAEMLLEYGIDMTKQNWLLDTAHLPKGLKENDDLYNNLLQLHRNPDDLTVLIRNKLRQMFRSYAKIALTQLGLPKALQDFVTCK